MSFPRNRSTTRSTWTSPSPRRKRCARYRNTIPISLPGTSRSRTLTPTATSSTRTRRTLQPRALRRRALASPDTWCMGGLSFFLFLILTLTGTLLMFYYHPSVDGVYNAYGDIKDLETVVVFGQLLRNMHRWAAHGMVITVFLHMIRVFYTGSYKPPRAIKR